MKYLNFSGFSRVFASVLIMLTTPGWSLAEESDSYSTFKTLSYNNDLNAQENIFVELLTSTSNNASDGLTTVAVYTSSQPYLTTGNSYDCEWGGVINYFICGDGTSLTDQGELTVNLQNTGGVNPFSDPAAVFFRSVNDVIAP